MLKKKKVLTGVSVMSNEQAYQISAWKAVSVIAGAVLIGIVSTSFAFFSTANSDHFILLATTTKVDAIEKELIGLDRFEATINSLQKQLDSIQKNQEYLIQRVDKLVERTP